MFKTDRSSLLIRESKGKKRAGKYKSAFWRNNKEAEMLEKQPHPKRGLLFIVALAARIRKLAFETYFQPKLVFYPPTFTQHSMISGRTNVKT